MKTVPNTKIQVLDTYSKNPKWRVWDLYPKLARHAPLKEHFEVLKISLSKNDCTYWNDWRKAHPDVQPQLSGINFRPKRQNGKFIGIRLDGYNFCSTNLEGVQLQYAQITNVTFENANLRESSLIQANLNTCELNNCDLTQIRLADTLMENCNLKNTNLMRAFLFNSKFISTNFSNSFMAESEMTSSKFDNCKFHSTNLRNSSNQSTVFISCQIQNSNLSGSNFIGAKFIDSSMNDSTVFGINAWNVELENTIQSSLKLYSPKNETTITVDDIRIAQFINLVTNNTNLKQIISSITNKGVLILGRFSDDKLNELKELKLKLKQRGFIPIIFNFRRPEQRDFSETVMTLAGLCKFVIADITSPKSVPLELQLTIPNLMIPFVTIIQENEKPFSMYHNLWNKYEWAFAPIAYDRIESIVSKLNKAIVEPALKMHTALVQKRSQEMPIRHINDVE